MHSTIYKQKPDPQPEKAGHLIIVITSFRERAIVNMVDLQPKKPQKSYSSISKPDKGSDLFKINCIVKFSDQFYLFHI